MKETSGEFSMTVVVIVGAILIVTLLTVVLGPKMGELINIQWNSWIDKANPTPSNT